MVLFLSAADARDGVHLEQEEAMFVYHAVRSEVEDEIAWAVLEVLSLKAANAAKKSGRQILCSFGKVLVRHRGDSVRLHVCHDLLAAPKRRCPVLTSRQ